MNTAYEGGCRCGAVRYQANKPPAYTFYCHCMDCQKTSGSPFSMELMVEKDAVKVTGPTSEYVLTGDSGKPVTRHFCPTCGSGVYLYCASDPDYIFLKVGTLDDASWVRPEMHIFSAAKQPWLALADELPAFAGMPEE